MDQMGDEFRPVEGTGGTISVPVEVSSDMVSHFKRDRIEKVLFVFTGLNVF